MKKWHLRGEKPWMMLLDGIMLAALCVLCFLLLQEWAGVPPLKFMGLTAFYGVAVFVFMSALDEYKTHVADMYEKGVIYVLSSLYSFLLTGGAALLLGAGRLCWIYAGMAPVTAICLLAENYIAHLAMRNAPAFAKPRLLVIETDNTDVKRVRRVKYGVMNYYDAWYESLDTRSSEDLERLISTEMDKYDAVCLLDSVNDYIHDEIVKAALERDIELFIVPKLDTIGTSGATLRPFDDVLTLHIPSYRLTGMERFFKRVTDIVFALLLLAVAALPMLCIALAVKLTSPGPVLYKQVRFTQDKKEFEIWKFRTMVQDAEKITGPMMAQKNDARITPLGKYLRACRLDELPQLINILLGDMSVVGPRPERPVFAEQFEQDNDYYKFRYAVKAGLTGLSHVYGRYSTYTYDRTCFDLMYITHYSYLLDLKIMLLTSKVMFMKSAAEGDDEYKLAPDRPIENLSSRQRDQDVGQ